MNKIILKNLSENKKHRHGRVKWSKSFFTIFHYFLSSPPPELKALKQNGNNFAQNNRRQTETGHIFKFFLKCAYGNFSVKFRNGEKKCFGPLCCNAREVTTHTLFIVVLFNYDATSCVLRCRFSYFSLCSSFQITVTHLKIGVRKWRHENLQNSDIIG